MTLNEIAYNILNLVRGGRSNNNDHISISQIKFNIKYYRAMLIRRDFTRNGMITRHLEQDLGCLELEKVDASKCCDLPVECAVYKTVRKIPKTIRFSFRDATHQEATEFLESMSQEQFAKVRKYMEEQPSLKHVIEYDCVGCQKHQKLTLEGMQDFF